MGNGLGFSTEVPNFGLPGGGLADWRSAAYAADSWKITQDLTAVAGVRWSVDTGRANEDMPTPLCSDVTATLPSGCTSGSTPLYSLFAPGFGTQVHQPYANFAPQFGLNYSPGDHKTSIRAGFGIFFESDVANNASNNRTNQLKQGAFFAELTTFCTSYNLSLADGSTLTIYKGQSLQTICQEPVAQSYTAISAIQQLVQSTAKAHALSPNSSYVGATLKADGEYGAPYRTPYSEQWNGGIQRELFKGAILSADYVHNSTLKVSQTIDVNHVGAARTLNTAAAQAAIAATTTAKGCAGGSSAAAINCAISAGATISDFASNGLDSGATYLGGYPASYEGKTPAQAAFPGLNPQLGQGTFALPVGRSGYDALQVVFKLVKSHPAPGLVGSNIQVSYSLSRIVSTATAGQNGSSDQFFNSVAYDNDHPTAYMGRASLDHTHELSFGGVFDLKYGPKIGLIGHFFSAPPATLTLDTGLANGGIFQTDLTGDGTVGDLAPGTNPGDYMHSIKPNNLQNYINNFNSQYAGQLTPAGKAVVAAGLFTQAQLVALQADIRPIANLPQATAISLPWFRTMDANVSYPIKLSRVREGLSLEPAIAFFNVFNLANYNTTEPSGTLNDIDTSGAVNTATGFISGSTTGQLNSQRTYRGVGTFDQGGQRSVEFELKLNF